jgi:hypothetical protein
MFAVNEPDIGEAGTVNIFTMLVSDECLCRYQPDYCPSVFPSASRDC